MSVDRLAAPSDSAGRLACWAFAILVVISPFRAEAVLAIRQVPPVVTELAITAGDVALVATLGLWVASLLVRPRQIRFGPAWLAVPVAGLLAVAWLGVPGSVDPVVSVYGAVKLSLAVALGLYVVNEVADLGRLLVPIAAMIAVQSVVGIGQAVAQHSLGLGILQEAVLDPARPGVSIVGAADGTRWLRAYGLTDHPNLLGGLLAFGLLILGALPGRTEIVRLGRVLVVAAGVAALVLTFSRAAWIALAVGLGLGTAMLAWMPDRAALRRWLATAAIAILVSVPLALPLAPFLAARADAAGPIATEERSIDERLALARVGVRLAIDHPVLGTGLGTFPEALLAAQPAFPFSFQPVHVVLLDAAAETGVVGGLCVLAIAIAPWVALVRIRRRWTPSLVAVSTALAAVTVVGLVDYYTWAPGAGRIWAWAALGMWVVAYDGAIRGGPDA